MSAPFTLLDAKTVEAIHDAVLNPGEVPGLAGGKSLASALSRVENRILYEGIDDPVALAAAYGTAIARGHCFNDANKRTAFRVMGVVLLLNGVPGISGEAAEIGDVVIDAARGALPEEALVARLRAFQTFVFPEPDL